MLVASFALKHLVFFFGSGVTTMGSSAPDLLAPKGQSDCERLTNIFVLDTGPLSALRDQDLRLGGRDALESRLVGQVAAMKLLCCAELPDKVGVLRMGASDACVDVRPTERWHSADGLGRRALNEEEDPGFLCCYRPDPEPADTSVPNPRRLARALRLALAELTDSGYESWKDSDLYVEKEQRARITMFLCGPALGLKGVEEDFRAAVAEVDSRDVELEILLHRSAYSPSFDQYGSSAQPKGELASGGVQISPLELRCSEADMATLSYAMDANFRHKIATEGHVTTLSAYSKTYLPGVRDERHAKYCWHACFPSVAVGGRGVEYPEVLSTVLWENEWESSCSGEEEREDWGENPSKGGYLCKFSRTEDCMKRTAAGNSAPSAEG